LTAKVPRMPSTILNERVVGGMIVLLRRRHTT
jgi:hypothetical protein